LSERIHSDDFARQARHPEHANAFTRRRKLPLPGLIAALLSMRGQSQRATLDSFFASLCDSALPQRGVSDRAFAKAREQLHMPALAALNNFFIERAEAAGLVPRWRGLRVVAADGSVLMPAVRPCLRTRRAANPDQRLFTLFLPGAELTLHAAVFSAEESERMMLVEAFQQLGPDDVLVLDRGYPAAWLVALLLKHGIKFCMRCDNGSGWAAQRHFVRGAADEEWVTLNAPSAADDAAWGCGRDAPRVRLVRQVSPSGAIRVLATNLDSENFPCEAFGELYHKRWRIEEAYKRLKHRMHLECVSGLSQQALIIDVAAKVLADNIATVLCATAAEDADLAARSRRCNRSYAATLLQRVLPRLVLQLEDWVKTLTATLELLGATTQRFIAGRSRPRPANHVKPHPSMCYKG
jgi:Transposase DDE domain